MISREENTTAKANKYTGGVKQKVACENNLTS